MNPNPEPFEHGSSVLSGSDRWNVQLIEGGDGKQWEIKVVKGLRWLAAGVGGGHN